MRVTIEIPEYEVQGVLGILKEVLTLGDSMSPGIAVVYDSIRDAFNASSAMRMQLDSAADTDAPPFHNSACATHHDGGGVAIDYTAHRCFTIHDEGKQDALPKPVGLATSGNPESEYEIVQDSVVLDGVSAGVGSGNPSGDPGAPPSAPNPSSCSRQASRRIRKSQLKDGYGDSDRDDSDEEGGAREGDSMDLDSEGSGSESHTGRKNQRIRKEKREEGKRKGKCKSKSKSKGIKHVKHARNHYKHIKWLATAPRPAFTLPADRALVRLCMIHTSENQVRLRELVSRLSASSLPVLKPGDDFDSVVARVRALEGAASYLDFYRIVDYMKFAIHLDRYLIVHLSDTLPANI